MKKTVLITGGLGFLGTNLIKYLNNRYEIRILDNFSVCTELNLHKAGIEILSSNLLMGDIRSKYDVEEAVNGSDIVVHLASFMGVDNCNNNHQLTIDTNITGMLNVLEACKKYNVDRFIFASSNAALGNQIPPFNENQIPKPMSLYGMSKLSGEALCSAYYHSYGLKTTVLRFSNCYGLYSEHKTSVVRTFLNLIKDGLPLKIHGNGEQTRDFVWAEDIAQALSLCIESDKQIGGEIFQIGSGSETSILDLVYTLDKVMNKSTKLIYINKRDGDINKNYSDISKARSILGYNPKVNLENGLRMMIDV